MDEPTTCAACGGSGRRRSRGGLPGVDRWTKCKRCDGSGTYPPPEGDEAAMREEDGDPED